MELHPSFKKCIKSFSIQTFFIIFLSLSYLFPWWIYVYNRNKTRPWRSRILLRKWVQFRVGAISSEPIRSQFSRGPCKFSNIQSQLSRDCANFKYPDPEPLLNDLCIFSKYSDPRIIFIKKIRRLHNTNFSFNKIKIYLRKL